jgi:hypothetical protein
MRGLCQVFGLLIYQNARFQFELKGRKVFNVQLTSIYTLHHLRLDFICFCLGVKPMSWSASKASAASAFALKMTT